MSVATSFLNTLLANPRIASLRERTQNPETQRRLVLIIVCIALLLDNMLYMVIVPIIPVFLQNPDSHPEHYDKRWYWYKNKPIKASDVMKYNLTGSPDLKPFPTDVFNDFLQWNALTKSAASDDQDSSIGWLFASKAIVQLFISPFAGPIIDRLGYERPLIVGLSVLFVSTSIFAFGRSYMVLFVARSLQGVGSAFADTAGLAMIADRFKEARERSRAQGIALAFISFGCLFAPPFGGFLYEFAGKAVPFLALSFIALVDGAMLLLIMQPVEVPATSPTLQMPGGVEKPKEKLQGTPIYRLILDPYIAICAGALVVANVNLAFLEPTIATYMKKEMEAQEWQIGLVWLPAFFPHVLGVFVTVKLMRAFPKRQWLITAVGILIEGGSCLIIPFCDNFVALIFPLMIDCFGIALVDTAIMPTLAYLVDVRHVSVYGSVYAIADISYSLAYAFGPVIGDWIYRGSSFLTLNIVIFVVSLLYAPVLVLLRNVYAYVNFEEEEEAAPGGTGYTAAEAKPIATGGTTDYRSYMMSTIKPENGSATQDGLPPTYNSVSDGGVVGQQAMDGSVDSGDVNRQYVQVGRVRSYSRDSNEDAASGDYRTYR